MSRTPLAHDTAPEIETMLVERWRAMSPTEKGLLITQLTNSSIEMARAGIRARYPDAQEPEVLLRLAVLTLGRDLACRAYPDAALLDD